MEQKAINKQEILDEIKKVLDLYNDNIISIGYSINITFKGYNNVIVTKNYPITIPYLSTDRAIF